MVESFWKTQPAEKGKSKKIISKPINITTKRHKLNDGLFWEINNDAEKITNFLKENYVEDEESLFRMYYSEKFLKYLFLDPKHRKEYSLSIVDSIGMAGYILAKEHDLVIKGIEQHVVSINFLCLRHDLRNMNLAPVLIKEITRVVNNFGIFHGIFTGHKDYGFSIMKSSYHHMILDSKRLFDVGFIDSILTSSCNKYMISSGTVIAQDKDLKTIYEKYMKKIMKYEIYEKFSEDDFLYVFKNCNCNSKVNGNSNNGNCNSNCNSKCNSNCNSKCNSNCNSKCNSNCNSKCNSNCNSKCNCNNNCNSNCNNNCNSNCNNNCNNNCNSNCNNNSNSNSNSNSKCKCNNNVMHMLYNKERNEYASFFVIESYSIEKKEYFSNAYLYYWDGSYRIIEDLICYAKSLGISLLNVLDLNDNNKIIKEFDMLEGTGELWYHLYNWKEESISNQNVNFILF